MIAFFKSWGLKLAGFVGIALAGALALLGIEYHFQKKKNAADQREIQAKTDVAEGAAEDAAVQHDAVQALHATEAKQASQETANPPDPEKHDDFDTDH